MAYDTWDAHCVCNSSDIPHLDNAHRNDQNQQTFLFPGLKFRGLTSQELICPTDGPSSILWETTRLHPPTTMGGKSVQNLALLDT